MVKNTSEQPSNLFTPRVGELCRAAVQVLRAWAQEKLMAGTETYQRNQLLAGENANTVGYWENTIGKIEKMSHHVSAVHRSRCLFLLALQTG